MIGRTTFDEVSLRVRRSGKCARCGKRTRRVHKLWQTANPFNVNGQGAPKSRAEIVAELRERARAVEGSPLLCAGCEGGLVGECRGAAPLLRDAVGDDGPRAARALEALTKKGSSGSGTASSPSKRDFARVNVPPARDPSWPARAAPLLLHISERPRTIDEVILFCQARGESGAMARQVLAWLSFTGQIEYDDARKVWDRRHCPRA